MLPGGREEQPLSTPPDKTVFPDGAALRSWVRRRTRRHRRGVWALVGDVYSTLLTIIVTGTILAPYLRRLVVDRPTSAARTGALGRLGPLFLRPHEAAWWLPMPGDRASLLAPVARVEYLIAATVGATAGVLPALAAGGGWVAAAAWPVLMSAGACLVLTELIKAQILGRGVEPLRRRLILTGVAACLAGAALPFPRSLLGNTAVALLAGALATALVASGIAAPTTTLLGIQAAAGIVAVVWGACTNRRAS